MLNANIRVVLSRRFTINIGIIGYPNVGKSTFFNTLVKKELAYAANLPFATIKPNVSNVFVEDKELVELCNAFSTKRIKPYEIKVTDIAGVIKDASKDETCLEPGYTCDAFVQVVRCFKDKEIHYLEDTVNPCKEVEIMRTEMLLSDISKLAKTQLKLKKDKNSQLKQEVISRLIEILNTTTDIINLSQIINQEVVVKIKGSDTIIPGLNLLVTKPVVYLINSSFPNFINELTNMFISNFRLSEGDQVIASVKNERDAVSLVEDSDSIVDFYNNINECFQTDDSTISPPNQRYNQYQAISVLDKVVDKLGYIKFYTVAGDSGIISSFIIQRGSNILVAAAKVHSNFSENFICAELSHVDDWKSETNTSELKLKGKIKKVSKSFNLDKGGYVIKFII